MRKIIYYDGFCNFCDGFINFIIKNEIEDSNLYFAPLSSEIAKEKFGYETKDSKSQYIVFSSEGVDYIKSEAVFEIFKYVKFPFNILSLFSIFPTMFTDIFYQIFAKYRYRIFGKSSQCLIPSIEIRKKFLS